MSLFPEHKPAYKSLPAEVLAQIAELTGEPIVKGTVAYGGYSASASFILTLASGRKLFAKGNHPDEKAHGTQNLRQEIATYQNVPLLHTLAPPYLGMVWDGDEDGWMLGIWEALEPAPFNIDLLIATLVRWHRSSAEEQGINTLNTHLQQNYIGNFFTDDKKWRRFRQGQPPRDKFLSLFAKSEEGEAWLEQNLATLIKHQTAISSLNSPLGLLHGDLRADNLLFSGSRLYVIDWPNACYGSVWFDLLTLFADLDAQEADIRLHSLCGLYIEAGGQPIETESFVTLCATVAGAFADQAYRAIPEKMPRLRHMQRRILRALLGELARLGVVTPIQLFT